MEWMQALWAFVALCAVAALWDAFVRRHVNTHAERLCAEDRLRAEIHDLRGTCTNTLSVAKGLCVDVQKLEASDKQRESDMIALSNKVNSAHSAAASRWRRP
jgi:hypothetical protein